MALFAKPAPVLGTRPATVSRVAVRPCRVTAAQSRSSQQKTCTAAVTPMDRLRETSTQLTGVAGLLVPLLLTDPAFAATPDGEHLTKVPKDSCNPQASLLRCDLPTTGTQYD